MATLQTTLTPIGYKTLMTKGLVSEISYYNFNDNYHNYVVTANEGLVPGVVGSHSQITMSQCAFAEYNGVFAQTPTTTEIQNQISRVQFAFVNEDCSYGNFNQPNINMNININSWLNQLSTLTYSLGMEGLGLDLWDYMTATIQTLNLSTKTYDDTKYLTNLRINWIPKTNYDLNNLLTLSPRYVKITAGVKEMVDNTSVRNGSPFLLSFSTYNVNGTPVNGTAGRFSLMPNQFGYWVNGTTFLTTTQVEQSTTDSYTTIYPAAKVGNSTFYLNGSTEYPTTAGFVGYALKMINVDGSGETLLTCLTNSAILFMKTYGIYDSTNGTYSLPINMNTFITNKQQTSTQQIDLNSISEKNGGSVRLNFVYNPSDITSPVIQLI